MVKRSKVTQTAAASNRSAIPLTDSIEHFVAHACEHFLGIEMQEPDGLIRQVMPNGIIVEKFPDGSKTQKNPDGTTQTTKVVVVASRVTIGGGLACVYYRLRLFFGSSSSVGTTNAHATTA